MADGNFKADHVRQKNEVGDIWLSEGSGMFAKREKYFTFLATAIERLTVCASILCPYIVPGSGIVGPGIRRRYQNRFPCAIINGPRYFNEFGPVNPGIKMPGLTPVPE